MAKKSKGVPAPTAKSISVQKLTPGERADLGTTSENAYVNQYSKNPPASETDDFMSAFMGRG